MTQTAQQAVRRPGIPSVATLTGWVMVALSLVVLAGWVFNLPALESFVSQSNAAKANSAVAMMLAAVALLRRDHRDRPVYPVFVTLIGALTLGEFFWNHDFGIDQLLFRDTHYVAFPGRLSQYTSMGYVSLGLSLLLMKSRTSVVRELSRLLAALTGTLGVVVLVSFVYATPALNRIGPHRNVAVPTAIGFALGAIGVHYANPFEGLVRLLHADNAGGAMLRRMLPAGLIAALMLGFVVNHADTQYRWESGFSMAVVVAVLAGCLVTLVVLTAAKLEREDLARRESEQRFRLTANTAPVMIWMSGTDKLCVYFNEGWLQFTGRPLEAELGNGWAEGVHPEDLPECMSIYVNSFDRREPFQIEYRLRRHDGEFRWIFDTGVPRFIDHEFAGYIGSCIDVTDRKLAADALADLGRKVLNAQEEERARIARELHDDVNQRLALLAWNLEALARKAPPSKSELSISIDSAVEQLRKVVSDIQTISRRLHASDLEYLGLAAAAAALCRETAAQQEVEIEFKCDPALPRPSMGTSLCLYRVLQEALQNAIKHSGERAFKVEMRGGEDEVRLSVSDNGVGFDARKVDTHRGLGLISMRERMRLVHGEFAVESEPGRGTTIRCRVTVEKENPGEQVEYHKTEFGMEPAGPTEHRRSSGSR